MISSLTLVDWRQRVAGLYDAVRAQPDPHAGWDLWRTGRDELFASHPQTPLAADDPLRGSGLPYWPYDPALRFDVELEPVPESEPRLVDAGDDGTIQMHPIGRAVLPIGGTLDVWWLRQYGGGIFIPLRDGTAGDGSYGGGRYLLDTAKGAWLGGTDRTLTLDLNFAYHPSCRYDPRWQCPLAPPGNTIDVRVEAGERL
ncbi:DUF1684 domain-containing protein [Aeromicrobium wangtongii]|uniref:DUF1684 domain-containing protein n=1 Tax=Aeromicrobium wangtongii TaxID=2969247 RepID=A0ABY5M600_9ACTN|nr:DUF1684 domain-containing protein [Aeromicrobium wangtongii]MCD9199973.1 DUF1684 domain-containing protein [Aeromicrobium wangtongii]UUP13590.1 DUF1684 domain-containing protein [Aeromicrobium wangtongii]